MKLIREGKITKAGLKKLWDPSAGDTDAGNGGISNEPVTVGGNGPDRPETGSGKKSRRTLVRKKETVVPDFLLDAFRQHEPGTHPFHEAGALTSKELRSVDHLCQKGGNRQEKAG